MTGKTSRRSRRQFLKTGLQIAAGGGVLAAAGLGWRASQQDVFSPFDGAAYAPWHSWQTAPMAGLPALVQMALLAASPHNTQPWLFRVQDGRIDVFADRKRHLGAFDPYRREMQIGIGCAVENIVLAAPEHEFAATVHPVPGELRLAPSAARERVAMITLEKVSGRQSELYRAIAHRHTDRAGYDRSRPLPEGLIRSSIHYADSLDVRIDLFETGPKRRAFEALVMDATRAIVADAEMEKASQHWFRKTPDAIAAHRDGLTLDAMGLPPLTLFAAKLLPPADAGTRHDYWLKQTREVHLATARMTGLISVRGRYDAKQNLAAGRVWQHMQLLATAAGVAMQPLNQPIEMADRERQLGGTGEFDERLVDLVAADGWQPTFAFRLGHPKRGGVPSPRRGVEDRLI